MCEGSRLGDLRTLVINLDHAETRMRRMARALDSLGLPYDRLPATSPETLSEDIRRLEMDATDSPLSVLEQSCTVSHVRAWTQAATTPGWTLILEDDVILAADVLQGLELVVSSSDADFVRIETFGGDRTLISRRPILRALDLSLHRLYGRALGTAAYLVTRQGAQKLLRKAALLNAPVDVLLLNGYGLPGLRMQQAVPALAVQAEQIVKLTPKASAAWLAHAETQVSSQIAQQNRYTIPEVPTRRKFLHSLLRKLQGRPRLRIPLSGAGPLSLP